MNVGGRDLEQLPAGHVDKRRGQAALYRLRIDR